ncbi:MAG: YraN family protein [Planctomycetota bacterium]
MIGQLARRLSRPLTSGNRRLGRRGEQLAEMHLKGLGMRLIDRNVRVPGAEIDLLMLDKDGTVVCVEVKTRVMSSPGHHAGESAITRAKSRRMARAARLVAKQRRLGDRALRLDVVAIDVATASRSGRTFRESPSGSTRPADVDHTIRHHRGVPERR